MTAKGIIRIVTLVCVAASVNAEDDVASRCRSEFQAAPPGRWQPWAGNPVLTPGPAGSWDAGALGSMTVLRVADLFHMYYEAWGIRGSGKIIADYDSLQIGHATSPDGVHWTKDPANPVLSRGSRGAWDHRGTWDPFVLYEEGVFKMWYGGGPDGDSGWGYAVSSEGTHFQKRRKLPARGADLNHVEDDHVVHDKTSGHYFMYYWDRKREPLGLLRARSANETDFDFAHAEPVRIAGLKHPGMYKFTHVFQDGGKWHMFFGEFVRPGCKGCRSGYATSDDGLRWTARNADVLFGQDAEALKVDDDLWLLYYGPDGYFDQARCDIRLAVFRGRLQDQASGNRR
jgi:hypothetical protein